MMNSESMQLPLPFGTDHASVAFAVDARPVMFSFTILPAEVTVTRGVRNPGMVPKGAGQVVPTGDYCRLRGAISVRTSPEPPLPTLTGAAELLFSSISIQS